MKASRRHPTVYLNDIATALAKIGNYTVRGKKAFLSDPMIQDAVLLQFAIIGESAAKLPLHIKHLQPQIPWKQIVGMRHIIVHDYSEVSVERIWDTIEHDLRPLREAIQALRGATTVRRAA